MFQDDASASSCTNLSTAIRNIAPTAVLVRVYPERRSVTHLFEPDFYRILVDRRTERMAAGMIRRKFCNTADWRIAHDFHLPTGTLYLTPEPHQNGYIPEDDHSFGLSPVRRIAIADGSY
ncbi:hypothetical protein [Streptomyces sp. NPDC050546]|uniref:hypothetical protein n=1 Tax=Streptomyces sp. NPDC050546 TaxID=3365628 RepID=UPI0037B42FC0